jgi:hypothetical protein
MSGMNALKQLPPHVARELRRHVSPTPLISPRAKKVIQPASSTQQPQGKH